MVFGVGTGLGISLLCRPDETQAFQAYPSEGGMVKMQMYNKDDREYYEFIRDKGYVKESDSDREDVSMVLGGCALPWIAEFIASKPDSKEKYAAGSFLYQEFFVDRK